MKQPCNPREAAYLALLASLKQERFIAESLALWQEEASPTRQERQQAYEIASGACRMALTLDYLALQATSNHKLDLKVKERALLRSALYQLKMMHGAPSYAVVNESVQLAKQHGHPAFAKFLNALLRKLLTFEPTLPEGNDSTSLSKRLSYPEAFISSLLKNYDLSTTLEILKAGNRPPVTMVRVRPQGHDPALKEVLEEIPVPHAFVARLTDSSKLPDLARSKHYYIQNGTPAKLIAELAAGLNFTPTAIADLCASPGGKLIAVHDLFPKAALHANDFSRDKMVKLKENLSKYEIKATLSCGPAESLKLKEAFDLVVVDAPCSNSGTFGRRAEARWRFSEASLKEQQALQLALLKKAAELVRPGGEVWYMTCSICKEENEEIVSSAQAYGLKLRNSILQTPNNQGFDGGYAAALVK